MLKRAMVSPEVRELLDAAGYVWDELRELWSHGKLNRDLDPTVAAALSVEQVKTWIAAARNREPAF